MPRGDRTGPAGQGPLTGRGLGGCVLAPIIKKELTDSETDDEKDKKDKKDKKDESKGTKLTKAMKAAMYDGTLGPNKEKKNPKVGGKSLDFTPYMRKNAAEFESGVKDYCYRTGLNPEAVMARIKEAAPLQPTLGVQTPIAAQEPAAPIQASAPANKPMQPVLPLSPLAQALGGPGPLSMPKPEEMPQKYTQPALSQYRR